MGLKDLLNAGTSIIGTKYDGKVKPLGQISEASQKRQGYLGAEGYWTERGYDRATTVDMNRMADSSKAMAKAKKNQG